MTTTGNFQWTDGPDHVRVSCIRCGWEKITYGTRMDAVRLVEATETHDASHYPAPASTGRDYPPCAGTVRSPERDTLVCVLAERHAGAHQAGNGTIWHDTTPSPLCGDTSRTVPPGGPDWVCVLDAGHAGHHTMRDGHHWNRMRGKDTA